MKNPRIPQVAPRYPPDDVNLGRGKRQGYPRICSWNIFQECNQNVNTVSVPSGSALTCGIHKNNFAAHNPLVNSAIAKQYLLDVFEFQMSSTGKVRVDT
jgi:hypothetical protein